MAARLTLGRLSEIVRYYQAGIVNLAFGYGLYALLVKLGLDIFLAQAIAHFTGMAFNYLTYSRHVFRDAGPAKLRFVISYAVNYVLSVIMLAGVQWVIREPYSAGLIAAILVSIINYFALKFLVFHRKAAS